MVRRLPVAAVVVLALVSSACGAGAATARTNNKAPVTHRLTVVVEKKLAPAAGKKLAVLVLISQGGGAPAGAVAAPGKPLTVLLDNHRLYRVKAELDSSCAGRCAASARVSGSADHRLEIVPSCRPRGSGLVCSKVGIVKVY